MSTEIFNFQTEEILFTSKTKTPNIYYYDNDYSTKKALRFDYANGKIYCNFMPDQLIFVDDPTIRVVVNEKNKGKIENPSEGKYPIETWVNTYFHAGGKVVGTNVKLTPNEQYLAERINLLQDGYLYEMTDVFDHLDYNNGQKITNKNQDGSPYLRA
ncbi:hypothetical protein BKI52_10910 [marine bacterium AO1-C]|nr:hypothetical protein BKI52_10910 [marine bacterium AO1-C]